MNDGEYFNLTKVQNGFIVDISSEDEEFGDPCNEKYVFTNPSDVVNFLLECMEIEFQDDSPRTEQPDPTAEALQEAADSVTYTTVTSRELDGSKVKYHILVDGVSCASFDDGSWQAYADKCFDLGIVPDEEVLLAHGASVAVAAPVTIGSYSDVSDEAVRAAGGTVSTNYDFGPKA